MNKRELKKRVDYYMSLKYSIKVSEMEEGGYFVKVPDLPGCMCDAPTLEELPAKLEIAKRAWIEGTLERGGQVPLPKKEDIYSGRFVVRMSKTLHRILTERAKQEGVSLNFYVSTLLTLNSERYRTATLLKHFADNLFRRLRTEVISERKEPFDMPFSYSTGEWSKLTKTTVARG